MEYIIHIPIFSNIQRIKCVIIDLLRTEYFALGTERLLKTKFSSLVGAS